MWSNISNLASTLIQWIGSIIFNLGLHISELVNYISRNLTATAIIGLIALSVATRNYLRKSGISIRGGFCTTMGYGSSQPHISQVILINQKDRPVTIYEIYLKIGHNFYLELYSEDESPLTLKPYECLKKEIPIPYLYGAGTKIVDLNKIFNDKRAKKKLALATDYGKYEVTKSIKMWHPIFEGLRKNHFIGTIRPGHIYYKNSPIGDGVLYCIEASQGEKHETIFIYKETRKFRGIPLKEKDIETKESLREYIARMQSEGLIDPELEFSIKEPSDLSNLVDRYDEDPIEQLQYCSFLVFWVIGKSYTVWRKLTLRAKNLSTKIKLKKRKR